LVRPDGGKVSPPRRTIVNHFFGAPVVSATPTLMGDDWTATGCRLDSYAAE
jgi:hypothetical protein